MTKGGTDADPQRLKSGDRHWRAFLLAPIIPCFVVGFFLGKGIYVFFWALVFCYLSTLLLAAPLYSLLRRLDRVSLVHCAVSGFIIGSVFPLILLIAMSGEAGSAALLSRIMFLLFGGFFGASIGVIFWFLSTQRVTSIDIKWSVFLLTLICVVPLGFNPFAKAVWSILVTPPPPLNSVSGETFNVYDYKISASEAATKTQAFQETAQALKEALEKILPPGTTKSELDDILMGRNRGGLDDRKGSSILVYGLPVEVFPGAECKYLRWLVTVKLNHSEQLESFTLSAKDGCGGLFHFE